MRATQTVRNPFALMLDPQAVLDRIEHSQRLEGLSRRVCRPLDRPLLARADGSALAAPAASDDESEDSDELNGAAGTDRGTLS